MAKPLVFLSHSKQDRAFVEQVANDLRKSGVSCWYDEWELLPGDSLRKKIFEDGIARCELFIVYITNHSLDSKWVQEEYDAAFVKEIEDKGGFLATFVESDAVIDRLPLDMKGRYCATFNQKNYSIPLTQIASKAWDNFSKKAIREVTDKNELTNAKLEQHISSLEKKIIEIQDSTKGDVPQIIDLLKGKVITMKEKSISLLEIYNAIAPRLVLSKSYEWMDSIIVKEVFLDNPEFYYDVSHMLEDIISPLVYLGLLRTEEFSSVRMDKPSVDTRLSLTELGKQVLVQCEYTL